MRRTLLANLCLLALLAGAHLDARAVPPLIGAVKAFDITAIRGLLQKGADVNGADVDGATTLHWAARLDAGEAADVLIKAGARANIANRYGVMALSLAAANGSGAMIDRLLNAGADPKAATADGETVLMTAARSGSVDGVKRLLTAGANVNDSAPAGDPNEPVSIGFASKLAIDEAPAEIGVTSVHGDR